VPGRPPEPLDKGEEPLDKGEEPQDMGEEPQDKEGEPLDKGEEPLNKGEEPQDKGEEPLDTAEKPLDTGGGRVFSLDPSFGLLTTASASALPLFFRLCAQLLWCELYDMRNIQIRPLQDIAIANIVWCMVYKPGVGGGGRVLRRSRAVVLQ